MEINSQFLAANTTDNHHLRAYFAEPVFIWDLYMIYDKAHYAVLLATAYQFNSSSKWPGFVYLYILRNISMFFLFNNSFFCNQSYHTWKIACEQIKSKRNCCRAGFRIFGPKLGVAPSSLFKTGNFPGGVFSK